MALIPGKPVLSAQLDDELNMIFFSKTNDLLIFLMNFANLNSIVKKTIASRL